MSRMLRFHELQQNPASVTFCDESGATITVVAERLRGGYVKMTCQCQCRSEAGWCKHCLAVFFDQKLFPDEQCRLAFKNITAGTPLEAAAAAFNETVAAFAKAYRDMKRDLPVAINLEQLHIFATKAYEASMTGRRLAVTLENFIRECCPTATPFG